MGRAHEKWHICKCLIFHAKNLLKVYNQKNSGYTKSRRKIRQQKIPKIDSKFLHIELLSREAWTSKDTRFLTLSYPPLPNRYFSSLFCCIFCLFPFPVHAACQTAAYQQNRQQCCIGNRTVSSLRENCKRYYGVYDLVDHIARR